MLEGAKNAVLDSLMVNRHRAVAPSIAERAYETLRFEVGVDWLWLLII